MAIQLPTWSTTYVAKPRQQHVCPWCLHGVLHGDRVYAARNVEDRTIVAHESCVDLPVSSEQTRREVMREWAFANFMRVNGLDERNPRDDRNISRLRNLLRLKGKKS